MKRLSFTARVLLGLFGGIACGLFFGERVAPVQVLATSFVKLLQMTVLPYVVLSIVSSVGSLSHSEARRLGVRVGAVIVALWCVSILFALLLPLSFPHAENASFFSRAMVEQANEFNFVDLYIPSNPFHSLANSVVPAIVLFSVVLGVALIGVARKERLLEVIQVGIETVSRATRFVVRLTPFGIFAIATHAAGTLSLEQLGRIQIYLFSYIAVALLLALWVLPGLVSALTPISVKGLFSANRDALVTAFVAGDLFIVLPSLMEACEQILRSSRIGSHEEQKLPEVIVPASFNFPHAGKLLSLSFILFAGWYADSALALKDYPQLAGAGLMTAFGSLNTAIPFLLDLFRIPSDTFQLYLATGVLNARFGTLVAAVHAIAVALLGSAAISGQLRFDPVRLARYLAMTIVLSAITFGGLRWLFSTVLARHFDGQKIILNMRPSRPHPDAVTETAAPSPDTNGYTDRDVLGQVRQRGILRVGYFEGRIPFAYRNSEGKLTGLEVEAAHLLASDIGVQPRFVKVRASEMHGALASGACDIVMSGVVLTPRRQAESLFSRSYLDETLGFAVLDHRRHEFSTWQAIQQAGALRVAVPNLPYYTALVQDLLPAAKLVPYEPDELKLDESAGIDTYVLAAEYGALQTMLQPKFAVVVPAPDPISMPVAYALANRDQRWADVVNAWIELRQKDGTFTRLRRHWILGESATARTARWSILGDVLGWK